MEGRKKGTKDQRKKITRKEKWSKREKFDKEKTLKMLEKEVSLSKEEIARNYDDFTALCPTGEMKIHSPQAVKVEKVLSVFYFHWSLSLSRPKVVLEVILEVVLKNSNQFWRRVNKI